MPAKGGSKKKKTTKKPAKKQTAKAAKKKTTKKATKKSVAKKSVAKKPTTKKKPAAKATAKKAAAPATQTARQPVAKGGVRLRVRQTRSTIGRRADFRRTLRALGIKHHQGEVVVTANPAIKGMLDKVRHLVRVTPEE